MLDPLRSVMDPSQICVGSTERRSVLDLLRGDPCCIHSEEICDGSTDIRAGSTQIHTGSTQRRSVLGRGWKSGRRRILSTATSVGPAPESPGERL